MRARPIRQGLRRNVDERRASESVQVVVDRAIHTTVDVNSSGSGFIPVASGSGSLNARSGPQKAARQPIRVGAAAGPAPGKSGAATEQTYVVDPHVEGAAGVLDLPLELEHSRGVDRRAGLPPVGFLA